MLSRYLLQQDTHGVKLDPDSSAVETALFSTREPTAVKQEPHGEAKVSHSSHASSGSVFTILNLVGVDVIDWCL
jgi:hypothetical protein